MKRAIHAALTCCAIAGLAIGASTPQKKAATPAKKTATVPAQAAPQVVKKGAVPQSGHPASASRTTAARTATAKPALTPAKPGTKTVVSRRYYGRQPARRYTAQQFSPTPDRYREIQDALAAKGYLKTPSTGVWDHDSVDAMQRFQQDQNLEPTGKLTARSLGALGLGPKPPVTSGPASQQASLSANPAGDASPLQ